MDKIGKRGVDILRRELEQALKSIEAKHDIKIEVGHISYNDSIADIKLKATISGEDGALTREQHNLAQFIKDYRFTFKMGDRFTFEGDIFELYGYLPKSRKYPMLGKNLKNGRIYKFNKATVLNQLDKV